MKKFWGIIIFYLLFMLPLMASESTYTSVLGRLTKSPITLTINGVVLEAYNALDATYVPISSFKNAGCEVLYDETTKEVSLNQGVPTTTSSTLQITSLNSKPFSLYESNIWIGHFKTHGIISDGKVLIPIGSLRQLWDIEITNTNYTLLPKEEFPIFVSKAQIENTTDYVTTLSLLDIYWEDKWVIEPYDYIIQPKSILTRSPVASNDNKLYITTLITKASNEELSFNNANMYGQLNDHLFMRFTRAKHGVDLTDLGDPLTIDEVLYAEDTVNNKGLHSSTPYLVWTNIDTQKTYIFEGSKENWRLIKHFICSTGRDYTPTPKGEFELTHKVPYFGVEKGYRCKNAFGFIGTTYLYHSIIFDKTGTHLLEGKGVLGTKASQGCIRFSVENSEWFYNNMLSGTKVWIN